jgi:hypothetical protein
MNLPGFSRAAIGIAAVLLGLTSVALAGPPLLCHPFEIGQARSLPWIDFNNTKADTGYDLKNLTRDTLALLNSNTPVLVRMETLRRATIYARQDPQVAKELIAQLQARAADAKAGEPGALAWFDLGYLAETYKQAINEGESNAARDVDGQALVEKAISLRGSDPEMEFAAALITLGSPQDKHSDHVQKAMAGANADPLLARNLASTALLPQSDSLLRTK